MHVAQTRHIVRNNFLTLVVQLTVSFVHSLLRNLLQRGLALILTLHNSTLFYFTLMTGRKTRGM